MKIEIISGSPRKNGLTRRVASHLLNELRTQHGLEVGLIDMEEYHLPPVQEVFKSALDAPAEIQDIAARVFDADAFILVTPEYNGSFSPALKNFLDHFPKQDRKVFGIVTASPGMLGGIRAGIQPQNLVYALFGIGSSRMLVVPEVHKRFDETGALSDHAFRNAVDIFVREFLWIGKAIHQARKAVLAEVAIQN